MALPWVHKAVNRIKHWTHECMCICCMLNANEWKTVVHMARLETVELKRQVELRCIFALPLDAQKSCLKMRRNKPLFFFFLFFSLFPGSCSTLGSAASLFFAVLPFLFLFWFLVLCFMLLNCCSHYLFVSSSNCRGKKKGLPNILQTNFIQHHRRRRLPRRKLKLVCFI